MTPTTRRTLLTAALTLPAAALTRKPARAEERLSGLDKLVPIDPAPLPELRFTLADGTARSLADYAGSGVVLNMWATWCAPCVAEMAALDELARKLSGSGVAVLALSSDRGGAPVVDRFYRERGIHTLAVLLDPRGEVPRAIGARGIPTTLLINRDGQERGRVEGAVDWSASASVETVRKLIAAGRSRLPAAPTVPL
jgi:thiol-disulfide isomerase/thioredoxin